MKITIITICYNSEKTIRRCIESVIKQNEIDLEYLIIDGNSKDNTINIIKEYSSKDSRIKWISEKDNGIYDAMNKGVSKASGDIVGILNSDDYFSNENVLALIHKTFEENNCDSCYGNILYIVSKGNKITPYRYWKSGKPRTFKYGWMPPHPAFFVKKTVYEKYGNFRLDCGTAADYELMLRLLEKNKISTIWVNETITFMEAGGASSSNLSAYKKSHFNDKNAWIKNELKLPKFMALLKKIRKLPQFIYAKFYKIDEVNS